jgi:predicted signal transduction protein with EAL and GGDEF domain
MIRSVIRLGICCCASLQSGCEALQVLRTSWPAPAATTLWSCCRQPRPVGDEALLTRLRATAEAPYLIEGTQLVISVSVGIAMYPKDGKCPASLLSNAEAAMQMAKSRGRSFSQFYTPALESRATRMLMQEQMLRNAVERGEFELHYQPQTSCRQASFRLRSPGALEAPAPGLVSPDEFIGFAETGG